MRLLILANMGPNRVFPAYGRFIDNQYKALKATGQFESINYYYLTPFLVFTFLNKIKYIRFMLGFVWHYVLSVKKLDVIHVHYYFPTIVLAVLYKFIRAPKVKIMVTFHGSDVHNTNQNGLIYRKCFKFVDQTVFVSKAFQEQFTLELTKTPAILCAGILDLFKPHPEIPQKKYDLLFASRLDFNKGKDRLYKLMQTSQSTLRIAVLGHGDDALVEKMRNTKHQVEYFLENATAEKLHQLYGQSRFIINLSHKESFGLVMAEAMATGTPVIASATYGSTEQIEQGVNGYIIDNDDDWIGQNLANFVDEKLNMPDEQYAQLCQHGIRSSQKYKLSTVCDNLLKLYQDLHPHS